MKYTLLGLGGLVVLAIAGAAVFALTFDPNRYKDEVERIAAEKTGRTLKLAGDIKLAFWPSLGADVSKVWLSERDNKTEFLSLDSAHASVKLMPLLKGQAIVDGIRVSGLRANVVKEKDGRFNFSDLLESTEAPSTEPAKKAEPKKVEPAEGGVAFDIAGIRIERAAVKYLDKASGQALEISDFKLITGRLAEKADGKIELAATVKGKNPDLALKVALDAGYRIDLPARSYAVSKLQAAVAGNASGQAIDARLSSPELVVSTDKAKGSLNADFKMPDMQANVKLAGIEGSAKALVIPELAAEITVKNMKIPVNGSMRADLEKQTANADLKAKLDDSNIDAKLGLAKFSPPAYLFDINIDQLNVDKHFPPEQKPAATPQPPKPGPQAKPQPQAAETPIDFSFLKGLDANGQIQIGSLQARGLKMAALKAKVRAAGGRLEVNPHSANLYEGSLTGALSVQADGNRIALKEALTGVNIGPLLREFAQKDLLEGKGNLALDITGAGATVEQIKKALAGNAKVLLRDGAIKGINLAETVRKAQSLFAGGGSAAQGQSANAIDPNKKTDFSELTASFTIKGGVAHNEDLDVKSPLFRIGGAGDIDIGNSRLDYTTKASVVATTKGQGGEDLQALRGVTVPVRLSGPFENLSYDVDFRGMFAGAAKSKLGAEVKERVQERLGERVDEDKIRDKVKDRLKGLLGR